MGLDPVETIGVLFGVVAVWLTVRENLWCWPIGIVNLALFIVVFHRAKLYPDMWLQVVYIVLCLYGWWKWVTGGGSEPLAVTRTPPRWGIALGVSGVLFWVGLATYFSSHTDASLPWWDSGLASFSLVAQYMQARKWLGNWLVWIAVDALYVGVYIVKGLNQTAVLYAMFLLLAIAGWRAWRTSPDFVPREDTTA